MQEGREDLAAVRREILALLSLQMEALDSPQGLTHEHLRECYVRQMRVQELREILEAATNSGPAIATLVPLLAESTDISAAA